MSVQEQFEGLSEENESITKPFAINSIAPENQDLKSEQNVNQSEKKEPKFIDTVGFLETSNFLKQIVTTVTAGAALAYGSQILNSDNLAYQSLMGGITAVTLGTGGAHRYFSREESFEILPSISTRFDKDVTGVDLEKPVTSVNIYNLKYKGANAISTDGGEVTRGQKVSLIDLPILRDVDLTQFTPNEIATIYEIILSDEKNKKFLDDNSVDWYAISLPKDFDKLVGDALGINPDNRHKISSLLSRRNVKVDDDDQNIILLSKETLQDIMTPQEEVVKELFENLGLHELFKMYETIANLDSNTQEYATKKGHILKSLNTYLERCLNENFNEMPNVVRGSYLNPQKEHEYSSTQLISGPYGMQFAFITYGNGEKRFEPVEKLLRVQDSTTREVIKSLLNPEGQLKSVDRGKLAYALIQYLSLNEGSKSVPKAELLQKIINLAKTRSKVSTIGVKPDKVKIFAKKTAPTLLSAGALALGIGVGIANFEGTLDKSNQGKEDYTNPLSDGAPSNFETQWIVESSNPSELSVNGAYIESTAIDYTSKGWDGLIATSESPDLVELHENIPSEDRISISRVVEAPLVGDLTFKIPIREGTTLGGLKIEGTYGTDIEYEVRKVPDGTYEIYIPNDTVNPNAFYNVTGYLVKSNVREDVPHMEGNVTYGGDPDLDISQLPEDDFRAIYGMSAEDLRKSPELFEQAFVNLEKFFDQMMYRIDVDLDHPDNLYADPGTRFLDALASLTPLSAQCSKTNSGYALASNGLSQYKIDLGYDSNHQNLGYWTGYNNTGKSDAIGMITGGEGHAALIDFKGQVVDKTPTEIDPTSDATVEFVNNVNEAERKDINETIYDLANKANANNDLMSIIFASASLGALYGAYRLSKKIGEKASSKFNSEEALKILDISESALLSEKDLEYTDQFLNWLVYSGQRSQFYFSPDKPRKSGDTIAEKAERIRNLRSNIPLEVIFQVHQNFDELTDGLTKKHLDESQEWIGFREKLGIRSTLLHLLLTSRLT